MEVEECTGGELVGESEIIPNIGSDSGCAMSLPPPASQRPRGRWIQDTIGWRRLLEGMLSAEVIALQREHLLCAPTMMSLERWSTGVIVQLLMLDF